MIFSLIVTSSGCLVGHHTWAKRLSYYRYDVRGTFEEGHVNIYGSFTFLSFSYDFLNCTGVQHVINTFEGLGRENLLMMFWKRW